MDRTTKLLLGAVALGIFANALQPLVTTAIAGDSMTCKVEGPIEVRIATISDEVELEWGFSQPGSSSSSPLFVRSVP